VVLMFIGAKMLASNRYELPTWAALTVIAIVLGLSVLASVVFPQKEELVSSADRPDVHS